MEKTSTKKTKKAITKEQIRSAYMEYVLIQGKEPGSIFAFAKDLKIQESDFYEHFNSFNALEGDLWKSWFKETIEALHNDEAYLQYTIREKILAFYYTWLEVIKNNRSFVLMRLGEVDLKKPMPVFWRGLKASFSNFVEDLILEGKDTGEIADRPWSKQYDKGFWMQFMLITKYWADDDSDGFQQTDALIEKASHFAMDIIGKGAIDSFLDLAKFLYQQRK